MTKKLSISPPGRYIAPTAVGFADAAGDLSLVTSTAPLPVSLINVDDIVPKAPPPLTGTTGTSVVAGPYLPSRNAPMHLQLSGNWQGTLALERSTDGGATRQALTAGGLPWASFSGNVNEPVWQENEAGVSFWLNITLTGGTLSYRLSQ